MTDPRQCWQCGGTGFRLVGSDSELQAECLDCGTAHDPANTYIPTDEDEREDYEIATDGGQSDAGVVQKLRDSHVDIGVIEGKGEDVMLKAGGDVLLVSRGEAQTLSDEIERKL